MTSLCCSHVRVAKRYRSKTFAVALRGALGGNEEQLKAQFGFQSSQLQAQ